MYKPGFGVVTTVVAVLCLIAFVVNALRPSIPPLAANRMAKEPFEFMRQGQNESIDWKALTPENMADARRQDRPILLMIGTPSNRVGHDLDELAFTDREVANYLHRNFTCIRVDAAASPQWLNAFLPFGRLRYRLQPDVQIWILDPTGVAYDFVARTLPDQQFDDATFLPVLIDLHRRFERFGHAPRGVDLSLQRGDQNRLASLGPSTVPFSTYDRVLRDSFDPAAGGFGAQGVINPFPLAWRYLLATAGPEGVLPAVETTLRSPLVDLLDGGFFHTLANSPAGRWVEFEKRPVENAEAMLTLSQLYALAPNPLLGRQIDEAWDYLARYGKNEDTFYDGQIGVANLRRRSDRYSFSSERLRELIPDSGVRSWAIANLGLDVAQHPQATPFLEHSDGSEPSFLAAISALRKAAATPPLFTEAGMADVSLTCAARAIETARILVAPDRMKQAIDWLENIESLRQGTDIVNRFDDPSAKPGYLGDYLAYADARLQDFLATGRVQSFDLGLSVLRRARTLFMARRPGVFSLQQPNVAFVLPGTDLPEIADNLHESCTARAIRLLLSYGRLLGDNSEGIAMRGDAQAAIDLFGPVAVDGGPTTAGYFFAAAEAMDEAFAVAVGPEAQNSAAALAHRVPTRLVAPAFGAVRVDLQHRAPGIYLVRGKIEGPMTVEQASKRLSPVFDLGYRLPHRSDSKALP